MTSKIKYINLSDKVCHITHISFLAMELVAEETTLSAATVPENEVFDVMNYINLNVTLVDLNGQAEIMELKK